MPQRPPPNWEDLLELLHARRLNDAADLCHRALEHSPKSGQWLLGLCWVFMAEGQLAEALKHASAATHAEPENTIAFRTMALVLLRMGRFDAALEAAQRAMHLDPDRASLELLNRIRDEIEARMPRDAKRQSTEMSRRVPHGQDPDELTAHNVLAQIRPSSSRSLVSGAEADAQLAALYGASLFGEWNESIEVAAGRGWTRHLTPLLSWRLISGLAFVLLVAAGMAGVVVVALRESQSTGRRELTERVEQLMRAGAVEQLAQLLDDSQTREVGSGSPLLRRAQATVYRFHDADPRRMSKISANRTYDEVVSRALHAARAERLGMLADLQRVDEEQSSDPQAAFLIADTLVRAGDLQAASNALERASALEPSNLLHIVTYVDIALRRGQRRAAENAALAGLDINPYSGWARVARRLLDDEVIASATDLVEMGPVTRANLDILEVHSAMARGEQAVASEHLTRALAAVSRQPPFLLDWLDALLERGSTSLARQVVASETWPSTPAGRAGLGRLLAAEGVAGDARELLLDAWHEGVHDPAVALALAPLMSSDPGRAQEILQTAYRAWPNRFDLRLRLAETLLDNGNTAAARTQLLGGGGIRRLGDRRLASEALTVLAKIAVKGGDEGEAIRLIKRALQSDRDNANARAMLAKLSPGAALTPRKKGKYKRGPRRRARP